MFLMPFWLSASHIPLPRYWICWAFSGAWVRKKIVRGERKSRSSLPLTPFLLGGGGGGWQRRRRNINWFGHVSEFRQKMFHHPQEMVLYVPNSPTRTQPVWKWVTADHFPLLSGVRCLNANAYHAPLVCNVSHPGIGCKACRMGTLEVHYALVRFPQKRLNARKENHPGKVWSGAAR